MVSQDDLDDSRAAADSSPALCDLPSPAGGLAAGQAESAAGALADPADLTNDGFEATVPCEDLSGVAGTGKTFLVRERIAADPEWGMLCATTGIAAVNLNTITLNSAIGYFDTPSLRDLYLTGRLANTLHGISKQHRNLVIDEKSMMDAEQLSLLYYAALQCNSFQDRRDSPFGLYLVGDFAQLPPVNAAWAFTADCWHRFAANSTKLTKIWRQEELSFLNALNAARAGDGDLAASILTDAGVEWHTALDIDYDGTTLVPKNDAVERYNRLKLSQLRSPLIHVQSRRWGRLRGEWKMIPQRAEFKRSAYVMILANSPMNDDRKFDYVNGDCGWIEEYADGVFRIRLARDGGRIVEVPRIVRSYSSKDKPAKWWGDDKGERKNGYRPEDHRNKRGEYVSGQVEYYPLRLAYASTVFKSQGLSLDKIQVDYRNSFFGFPAMLYVALSRCRTLAGLRLVGSRDMFIHRCNSDPRVQEFL